jgi:hypothetical protein
MKHSVSAFQFAFNVLCVCLVQGMSNCNADVKIVSHNLVKETAYSY